MKHLYLKITWRGRTSKKDATLAKMSMVGLKSSTEIKRKGNEKSIDMLTGTKIMIENDYCREYSLIISPQSQRTIIKTTTTLS